jgi:hypothetical protein
MSSSSSAERAKESKLKLQYLAWDLEGSEGACRLDHIPPSMARALLSAPSLPVWLEAVFFAIAVGGVLQFTIDGALASHRPRLRFKIRAAWMAAHDLLPPLPNRLASLSLVGKESWPRLPLPLSHHRLAKTRRAWAASVGLGPLSLRGGLGLFSIGGLPVVRAALGWVGTRCWCTGSLASERVVWLSDMLLHAAVRCKISPLHCDEGRAPQSRPDSSPSPQPCFFCDACQPPAAAPSCIIFFMMVVLQLLLRPSERRPSRLSKATHVPSADRITLLTKSHHHPSQTHTAGAPSTARRGGGREAKADRTEGRRRQQQ